MQLQVRMPMELSVRPALVESLLSPAAYPDHTEDITLVETHVSYVFMTGEFVYKVKKAVDYGFLDFTSLAKRRHYCYREVELNSRISPDVYIGVVPVRQSGDRIKIGGPGATIEYAVKMRQLSADRALDRLLLEGKVTARDVAKAARHIAEFHERAASGPDVVALGNLDIVRHNVEENFEQTAPYVGQYITGDDYDDIVAYSRAFMETKADVFERRAENGRIRDGHGDLHAGNIFLDQGVRIIDCIEFNPRFRCADVAEDVAFLAMDLDHFGRPGLSNSMVSAYVEASGDEGVWELLDFFKAYRAYVRGKVTAFRLDNPDLSADERRRAVEAARTYFKQAHGYAAKLLSKPTMILVTGLMGTGKTSVAREVARRLGAAHVSTDATRKALAGITPTEHVYEPYGQGLYTEEGNRRTYDAVMARAEGELSSGRSVVLDGSFRKTEERRRAADTAKRLGADLVAVECTAPDSVIKARLDRRTEGREQSVSDGRWDLYRRQRSEWEPLEEVEGQDRVRLNTIGRVADGAQAVIWWLFGRALSR